MRIYFKKDFKLLSAKGKRRSMGAREEEQIECEEREQLHSICKWSGRGHSRTLDTYFDFL